jgi:hypothetical protein
LEKFFVIYYMPEDRKNSGPDFIGIGAMKAATTWIFQCLVEHPQVCSNSKKELHFFDKPEKYKKGIELYLSFFKDCPPHTIKGEFTPAYIFSKQTPDLIYKHFPDTKIIACLRNPADRAASHYRFNIYKNGRLSIYKDFSQAIRKDKEIIARGKYYEQLKRYFDLFAPENIFITIYEELKEDPAREIKRLYDFLGIDSSFTPASLSQKKNVTGDKRIKSKRPGLSKLLYTGRRFIPRESRREKILQKYGVYNFFKNILQKNKIATRHDPAPQITVTDRDKQYLRDVYRDDIEKLEELIGKDLSIWK